MWTFDDLLFRMSGVQGHNIHFVPYLQFSQSCFCRGSNQKGKLQCTHNHYIRPPNWCSNPNFLVVQTQSPRLYSISSVAIEMLSAFYINMRCIYHSGFGNCVVCRVLIISLLRILNKYRYAMIHPFFFFHFVWKIIFLLEILFCCSRQHNII